MVWYLHMVESKDMEALEKLEGKVQTLGPFDSFEDALCEVIDQLDEVRENERLYSNSEAKIRYAGRVIDDGIAISFDVLHSEAEKAKGFYEFAHLVPMSADASEELPTSNRATMGKLMKQTVNALNAAGIYIF